MSAIFQARYSGRCGECDGVIKIGDDVLYVDDELCHASCPQAVPDAAAEPCPRCFMVPAANGSCGCD